MGIRTVWPATLWMPRGLHGLREGHGRQNGGESPRQHRLARPQAGQGGERYRQNACLAFYFTSALPIKGVYDN